MSSLIHSTRCKFPRIWMPTKKGINFSCPFNDIWWRACIWDVIRPSLNIKRDVKSPNSWEPAWKDFSFMPPSNFCLKCNNNASGRESEKATWLPKKHLRYWLRSTAYCEHDENNTGPPNQLNGGLWHLLEFEGPCRTTAIQAMASYGFVLILMCRNRLKIIANYLLMLHLGLKSRHISM